MTFREAVGNEFREAGRGVAANAEGKAGEYRRQDTGPARDPAAAREEAARAEHDHHAAADADRAAQQEAEAAEAESRQQEADGPEYGD